MVTAMANATSGRTADLSRRHTVRTSASGVVTVTGGKLTTYRKMAEDAVDAVVDHLGRHRSWRRRTATKKLLLRGAEGSATLLRPLALAPQ